MATMSGVELWYVIHWFALVGAVGGAIVGTTMLVIGFYGRHQGQGSRWDSDADIHEPGWYQGPYRLYSHQAYWDGAEWSGETRPQNNGKLVSYGLTILLLCSTFGFVLYVALSDFLRFP